MGQIVSALRVGKPKGDSIALALIGRVEDPAKLMVATHHVPSLIFGKAKSVPVLYVAVAYNLVNVVRKVVELAGPDRSAMVHSMIKQTCVDGRRGIEQSGLVAQAISVDSVKVLALLVELGADLGVVLRIRERVEHKLDWALEFPPEEHSQNALEYAIDGGNLRCVEHLIETVGMDPTIHYRRPAQNVFLRLLRHGDQAVDVLKVLLKGGWDYSAVERKYDDDVKSGATLKDCRELTILSSFNPPGQEPGDVQMYRDLLCPPIYFSEVMIDEATVTRSKKLLRFLTKTLGLTVEPGRMELIDRDRRRTDLMLQVLKEIPEKCRAGESLDSDMSSTISKTVDNSDEAMMHWAKQEGRLSCAFCLAINARHHCSLCKKERYCSKECQRNHWPSHKEECNAGGGNRV